MPGKFPRKKILTFAGLAVLACILLSLTIFFLSQDVDTLRDRVRDILQTAQASSWSFPIVCGLYVLSSLIMFPVIALNLATSMVFGPFYGFVYALCGSLLSATIFFYIGRFGRNRGLKKLLSGAKISRLDAKLRESGVVGIATLRLVPLAPFGVFNTVAGITSLRFIDYIAGTFIGFWPGGVARAVLGDSLVNLFLNPSPKTFLYLLAGIALWGSIVLALHLTLRKFKTPA